MWKKVIAFALLVTMLAVFSTSAMAAWHHDSHGWWWTESNGSYAAGMWRKINGVWYAFGYDGYMLVGAYYIDGNLYNFDASGAMSTGWRFIDGDWYYFTSSGAAAMNRWVGNYYLGADGAMLTNTITPDGYLVGADGKWIPLQ